VTAGTVFHGTRVSLRVWFLGIFFVARHKKGISARQFQRDSGVGSYQTAWTLLHKLRSGLAAVSGQPETLLTRVARRDSRRSGAGGIEQRSEGSGGKVLLPHPRRELIDLGERVRVDPL